MALVLPLCRDIFLDAVAFPSQSPLSSAAFADLLGEPVDAGRRIAAGTAVGFATPVERAGACYRGLVKGIETFGGQVLGVVWQVVLEAGTRLLSVQECGLVLEMQQRPELEARILDRKVDMVRQRLLARVGQVGMLVDVEHTPDLVVAKGHD